jgi:glucose/arabinose dehydrogenase
MKKYSIFHELLFMRISCLVFFVILASNAYAQPQLTFTTILNNVSAAVDIKHAGDGSNRLFIVQQSGAIRVYKNGALLTRPFLNIANLIKYNGGEQGLLSVAFPPGYKQSGYFFIYYNANSENVTLARYRVSAANPDVADPASGVILFSYPKPGGFGNHNGGCLQFGKDGYLYSSIGDGGSAGDPFGNAQNLSSPFGKILRLDVKMINAPYYKIPADNPFANTPNAFREIWSLGLRNTWRWSFDRETGDTWIGDVGQDLWEEVDYTTPQQSRGANYGWRCYEGNRTFNTDSCRGKRNYTFPVLAYPHNSSNGGFSVIGGYVYRGNDFPALKGYYICADYLSNNAWKIISNGAGGWNISLQKNVPASIVTFGEDEAGELYAATLTGTIYRVGTQSAIASTKEAYNLSSSGVNHNYIFPTIVTNNKITLVMKDNFKTVRITDSKGQLQMLQQLTVQTGVLQLSLPSLSAGMYMIELSGNTTFRSKIFIQ